MKWKLANKSRTLPHSHDATMSIRLTRLDLYEKVWSKPLSQLAKEYGLSDVGLAKICDRHHIPRPGAGYWARLAHGQTPNPTPLPPPGDGESEVIEVNIDPDSKMAPISDEFEDTRAELERIRKLPSAVIPSDGSTRLKHALVLRLPKIPSDLRPNNQGRLSPWESGLPNLQTTRDSWARGLRILDTLFLEAERRGYKVCVEQGKGTLIKVMGEDVGILLREKVKQAERRPTAQKGGTGWPFESKYEYIPTGQLCLSILNLYRGGARTNWADTEHLKIEDRLTDFFEGLVEAAAIQRKRKLEAQERERQWAEEAKRRFEREQMQRREQAFLDELLGEAERWQKSQLIRAYIEARRNAAIQKDGVVSPASDLGKWLAWAKEHADRLDPLISSLSPSKKEAGIQL